MKPLKKHPKQQRMEEMTFPIFKTVNAHSVLPLMDEIPGTRVVVGAKKRKEKIPTVTEIRKSLRRVGKLDLSDISPNPPWFTIEYHQPPRENKIWEGREYLRSINDDLGFTLLPRIVWRVVAVGVLVGAVIYFLSKYGYIR